MESESVISQELLTDLVRRVAELPGTGRRRLVGIAGAPASGKSTLAAALTQALTRQGRMAENVPMDGFHLDNRVLNRLGLRDRKGAPETFDAMGFLTMARRIRDGDELYFPIFDRGQDQAIAGAGHLPATCEFAVVEGNYLLFDSPPWDQLAALWDLSVFVETPEAVVRARCIQRWLDNGHTLDAANARTETNDLANARLISERRLAADVVVTDRPKVET